MSAGMEWDLKAQFEGGGGDRVGLLAMNDGHWAICWAYAPSHGMQLVSYDAEHAQEIFDATRRHYELNGGLRYDSRTEWQKGSL
ncbi:hypothetical protein ACFU9Y_04145 [Streptomyces sp. NPDC057621]|uniref:hypothetical protein n=1 Tax=Streptomyces sp. NPDC057621 TaxID=3346186 RepID=UPI0036B1D97F